MSGRRTAALSVFAMLLMTSAGWSQVSDLVQIQTWRPWLLDQGRYHVGDGEFTETIDPELVAQNAVVGPKWSIAFAVDRPTAACITIDYLTGLGGVSSDPNAAMARVSINGTEIGVFLMSNNKDAWLSALFAINSVNTPLTLTIESLQSSNWDDFVFEGVAVRCQDPNAVVTVLSPGQVLQADEPYNWGAQLGQTEPPPQMPFEPMAGTPLTALGDGQTLQWTSVWSVTRLGYQLVLRRGDGWASVVLPLAGVGLQISDPNGVTHVRGPGTGTWMFAPAPHPALAVAARVPPTGMAAEQPGQLGPWSVSFTMEQGCRWMMLSDGQGTVYLTDRGEIIYADAGNPYGRSFTNGQ